MSSEVLRLDVNGIRPNRESGRVLVLSDSSKRVIERSLIVDKYRAKKTPQSPSTITHIIKK